MSNIADGALAALEQRGWIQGQSHDPTTGRMCLAWAVLGLGPDIDWFGFYRMFMKRYGCPPPKWNDTPGRTFDEVREALKLVSEDIEIEKEKGIVE